MQDKIIQISFSKSFLQSVSIWNKFRLLFILPKQSDVKYREFSAVKKNRAFAPLLTRLKPALFFGFFMVLPGFIGKKLKNSAKAVLAECLKPPHRRVISKF